jgi:H+-translocating NAD(P) transhydrogenase subunit beta
MPDIYSIIIPLALSLLVLLGIKLMSSPRTAVYGNLMAASAMLVAVILVLFVNGIIGLPLIWAAIATGGAIGYFLAVRITMIKMPQMVALLNGCGGGASALVALVEIMERSAQMTIFTRSASQLALVVGGVTLSGSLIAAAKLDRRISQKPVILPGHSMILITVLATIALLVLISSVYAMPAAILLLSFITVGLALLLGTVFAIRVGGADMPITISLLNSFSGLAGAIVGLTISEPLLVSIGAIVGASGLILTKLMCSAMNRSLGSVLTGSYMITKDKKLPAGSEENTGTSERTEKKKSAVELLQEAKKVIIVPGYGLAVAQAQAQVKRIMDTLEQRGTAVKFAIHPVAGRMPGHMNVLLAEADVPYDKLCEMDDINPEFKNTDTVIIVGACDVVNPAANTAEGTPIYGMPVLKVEEAASVIVCNLDTLPGYSGVGNTLYTMPHVCLLPGNAADTLEKLEAELGESTQPETEDDMPEKQYKSAAALLQEAKKVIIVPGYGLAVAQAQAQVKKIMDTLEQRGVG